MLHEIGKHCHHSENTTWSTFWFRAIPHQTICFPSKTQPLMSRYLHTVVILVLGHLPLTCNVNQKKYDLPLLITTVLFLLNPVQCFMQTWKMRFILCCSVYNHSVSSGHPQTWHVARHTLLNATSEPYVSVLPLWNIALAKSANEHG